MSNYLNILQLRGGYNSVQLEKAYKFSRLRYLRLTSSGSLKYYRSELLDAADRAYRQLKQPALASANKPISLLARRIANQRQQGRVETTAKSAIAREDEFCREVIYRLEGDLIRFDSRQELLQLASQWKIPLFKANLLIAQIVEAVRQNKLYKPTKQEKKEKNRERKSKRQLLKRIATILLVTALALLVELLLIGYLK